MIKDKNVSTFNKESENYFKARPSYPKELFEVINSNLKENQRAWDSACGTGQVAKSLINYFDKVMASDINENQIKNGFRSSKISYSLQSSEKTNYKSSTFDLVCVAQAMHWFHLDSYFEEVKRVLKPGGIFACFGYSFFDINKTIDGVIERTILKPIHPYWSEKNRILWDGYKDVDFPFTRIKTPEIEMTEYWDKDELLKYIKTWSAYKNYIDDRGKDLDDEYFSGLKSIWPEGEKKKIKMNFTLYLGRN